MSAHALAIWGNRKVRQAFRQRCAGLGPDDDVSCAPLRVLADQAKDLLIQIPAVRLGITGVVQHDGHARSGADVARATLHDSIV